MLALRRQQISSTGHIRHLQSGVLVMHTLQERLEDEEMEKMRLAAALATLRADMESLSAAPPTPDMREYNHSMSPLQTLSCQQ